MVEALYICTASTLSLQFCVEGARQAVAVTQYGMRVRVPRVVYSPLLEKDNIRFSESHHGHSAPLSYLVQSSYCSVHSSSSGNVCLEPHLVPQSMTEKADIYSLAMIYFTLISRRLPFARTESDRDKMLLGERPAIDPAWHGGFMEVSHADRTRAPGLYIALAACNN